MELTDIPEVQLASTEPRGGLQKYLVFSVSDADGAAKPVVRSITLVTLKERHEDIRVAFEEELARETNGALRLSVLGGGFLHIRHDKKTIRLHDSSLDYGCEVDRGRTALLVQAAFPEHGIVVTA